MDCLESAGVATGGLEKDSGLVLVNVSFWTSPGYDPLSQPLILFLLPSTCTHFFTAISFVCLGTTPHGDRSCVIVVWGNLATTTLFLSARRTRISPDGRKVRLGCYVDTWQSS